MLTRIRRNELVVAMLLLIVAVCTSVALYADGLDCDSSSASEESSIPLFYAGEVENILTIAVEAKDSFTINVCQNGQLVWTSFSLNGTIIHDLLVSKHFILHGTELSKKSLYIFTSGGSSLTLEVSFNQRVRIYPPVVLFQSNAITRPKGYTYHVITVCDVLGLCQVAISSVHKETINIGVSITMKPASCTIHLGDQYFKNGDYFTSELSRYTAIQLQSECDLTGTVIKSTKRLSVFSGGIQTVVGEGGNTQTFMGTTIPLAEAGKKYVVVASQFSSFGDFIKILTTEDNTTLNIHGQEMKMENRSMVIRKRIDPDDALHVTADKTIIIIQMSWDYMSEPVLNLVPPFRSFSVSKCERHWLAIFFELHETFGGNLELQKSLDTVETTRIHGTEYMMSMMYQDLCERLDDQMVVIFDRENIKYINVQDTNQMMYDYPETTLVPDQMSESKGTKFVLSVFKLDPDKYTLLNLIAVANTEVKSGSGDMNIKVYLYIDNGRRPVEEKMQQINNGVYHALLVIQSPEKTVIVVQSEEPITLRSMIYCTSNSMVAAILNHPIDTLGMKYLVGMFWTESGISMCMIVAQSKNDTNIDVMLPDTEYPLQVNISGTVYTNIMKISRVLHQYTHITLQSNEDLTGTFIYADQPVAVFCGQMNRQDNDNVYDTYSFVTAEQFPPIETFGKSFNILMQLNLESINNIFRGNNYLKLVASLHHTLVTVTYVDEVNVFDYLEFPGSYIALFIGNITKIVASKEILVLQEIVGDRERSLVIVVPNHQSESRYQFATFPELNDNTAVNGTEFFVAGSRNISAFTIHKDASGQIHSKQLDDGSLYTAMSMSAITAYIIENTGMYGSSAGNLLKTKEICVYGKEPDTDCDGFVKEDLCILDTYNENARTDNIQLTTPDAGFDISIRSERDLLKHTIPLSMYGFRIIQHNSIQFLVKACDDVRIYLSMSMMAWRTSLILYEIAVGKDEVHIRRHDIGSSSIDSLASKVSNNCLSCLTTTKIIIAWGIDLSLVVVCEEDTSLLVPDVDGYMVQDVHVMTASGSTGQWNCFREAIPSYVGEVEQYLPDFDLDGNLDEDCAFKTPDCGYPEFGLFTLVTTKTKLPTEGASQILFDVGTTYPIICPEGFNHSGSNTTKCLPTGFWSKEFKCSTDVTCSAPPRKADTRQVASDRIYEPGDAFEYKCIYDYTMFGSGVIKCGIDGHWSNSTFTCTGVVCSTPPRKDGTKEIDFDPSRKYKPGDVFEYQCITGYTMFGSRMIECYNDGQWSDSSITCSECTCPCNKVTDMTEDTIKEIKDTIRKQNLIDKKSVSKYKRKKTSAPDNRFSAKAIGYVGVMFLCSAVLVIILFDIVSLANTVRTMTQNVGAFFHRFF